MKSAATELETPSDLLSRLAESRQMTDELFRVVHPDAMYERPIAERNRIIFYLGHLEAFDWNLIGDQTLGLGPIHKEYDRLFAFGIDPVGGGLPTDQPSEWPDLAAVSEYNQQVRQELDKILSDSSPVSASRWRYPREVVLNVAVEHRLMHAETLPYMFHQLPIEQKIAPPSYCSPTTAEIGQPMKARMVEIPAGSATLGIPRGSAIFGWDNEFEEYKVEVPAFAIDAYNVTNGEFLHFIREGGYSNPSFWSEPDWAWIKEQNIRHPRFWSEKHGLWFYEAMFEELPLPLNWPVYVSHAEAAAYARFAGKALPTEAQFHRAAYGTPEGTERFYPWGNEPSDGSRGNLNFHRWDPVAVGTYPGGRSAFGVEDLVGNGWEWTSSLFAPFVGFEPFPFYRGYSANFFDGKHYVMKGASPRTAACMARRSFRNWFQAHYPFVYVTFRCVSN